MTWILIFIQKLQSFSDETGKPYKLTNKTRVYEQIWRYRTLIKPKQQKSQQRGLNQIANCFKVVVMQICKIEIC